MSEENSHVSVKPSESVSKEAGNGLRVNQVERESPRSI